MAIRGLCTLVGAFALTLMAAVSNAQAVASTPIPGAMLLFTTALASGSAICALGRRASAV